MNAFQPSNSYFLFLHKMFWEALVKYISLQCRIHPFFGRTVFLKLRIGWFSDTPKPSIIEAECPKISDVQCIWGRIFESLEKSFVSQVFVDYISFRFYVKHTWKNIFLGAHTVQTVPKYIWMRHCPVTCTWNKFLRSTLEKRSSEQLLKIDR